MLVSDAWSAVFIGTVGVLYLLVAWRLRRPRAPTTRASVQALRAFEAWWVGVALLFILASISILSRSGAAASWVEEGFTALGMLAVCAAVWGLVTFVLFVYRGKHEYALALRSYYALVALLLLAGLYLDHGEARAWSDSVAKLTILTGPLVSLGIILFLIPAIIACGFYASLYGKLESREQKLRVGFTSVAFIAWFGVAILARVSGVANADWWPIIGQGVGVAASLLVVLAYWPPRWLIAGGKGA